MTALVEQLVDELDTKITKYILIKTEYENVDPRYNFNQNYLLDIKHFNTFCSPEEGISAIKEDIKAQLKIHYFGNYGIPDLNEDLSIDFENICQHLSCGEIKIYEKNNNILFKCEKCSYEAIDIFMNTYLNTVLHSFEYISDDNNYRAAFFYKFSYCDILYQYKLIKILG